MPQPLFITFEGGDGVGKSTQVKRLVAQLDAAGFEAVATREPGGSAKAEAIRQVILSGSAISLGTTAEAILFSAARLDHVETTIRPALARGACVVCDRFTDSTAAYQGVLGEVSPRVLATLARVAVGPTRPDVTFILDLPAALGLCRARVRRAAGHGVDRFEREGQAFHERLRQAFMDIAAAEPERCILIDASGDPDHVAADVWAAVAPRLAVPPTRRLDAASATR